VFSLRKILLMSREEDAPPFPLGRLSFTPAERQHQSAAPPRTYLKHLHPPKMPILNGDAARPSTPLVRNKKILDYKTALNVLEDDYESRDGLDVQTLLDSKEHGALTYNDFLVLPGYIGKTPRGQFRAASLTQREQASPLPK
jgi:hypothetical protein